MPSIKSSLVRMVYYPKGEDECVRRFVIERCGVPESDIRKIRVEPNWFGYTVMLWNWRRIFVGHEDVVSMGYALDLMKGHTVFDRGRVFQFTSAAMR